ARWTDVRRVLDQPAICCWSVSLQGHKKPLAPRGISRVPSELVLGFCVRAGPNLGHHLHEVITGNDRREPFRNMEGAFSAGHRTSCTPEAPAISGVTSGPPDWTNDWRYSSTDWPARAA